MFTIYKNCAIVGL